MCSATAAKDFLKRVACDQIHSDSGGRNVLRGDCPKQVAKASAVAYAEQEQGLVCVLHGSDAAGTRGELALHTKLAQDRLKGRGANGRAYDHEAVMPKTSEARRELPPVVALRPGTLDGLERAGGGGGERRLEAGREVHVALPRAGGERPWLRRPARRVGLLHSRGGAPSKQEGAHSSKDGRGTNEGAIIYNPKLMQGPYVQRTDVCCELGMQGCRVCRKANASKNVTLNRALTRRDLMPVIERAQGIGNRKEKAASAPIEKAREREQTGQTPADSR
jgi:hypothetical protein